ncbi:MAG TPA: ABC transporter ATP-binding protein [Gemmatimonadales bacterium]
MMIELVDLHRTYRKGTEEIRALDGVSLTIDRAEFVAVVGPSGSGKSTLMNVMGLLDRPDSGLYRLEGRDVGSLTPDELARLRNERIGFVFQLFHLLPRTTAVENVELPLVYSDRRDTRGLGLKALERVGLADRATHLPGELSGGQQQRVAIARALVQGPDLILADEPTGNLDSKSGAEILQIFRQLNGAGTTIVVITHDAQVSRYAERTIAIGDGRILSDSRAAVSVMLGGR